MNFKFNLQSSLPVSSFHTVKFFDIDNDKKEDAVYLGNTKPTTDNPIPRTVCYYISDYQSALSQLNFEFKELFSFPIESDSRSTYIGPIDTDNDFDIAVTPKDTTVFTELGSDGQIHLKTDADDYPRIWMNKL